MIDEVKQEMKVFSTSAIRESDGCFAFEVKDDSLSPLLMKGDTVLCELQGTLKNGEICLVLLDGVIMVRRVFVFPEKEIVMMKADNPEFEPITYRYDEVENLQILGRVKRLYRDIVVEYV